MSHAALKQVIWVLVALLVAAMRAPAQLPEAGTFAAVQGKVQLQRAGVWQDASVGVPVMVGDRLKTGATDRAKVVFRDDTVLDLAPSTEITLDTQVFDPGAHRVQSTLHLVTGKVRAWVSEYYRAPRARYEVETPTAVAGVRGTEFVALFNPATDVTEILGIAEQVEVTGKLAVVGGAVQVGPQFYTQVQKGRFPTAPVKLDDARFRQYLQGLDLIGTGRRDGLNVLHPAIAGKLLAPGDLPGPEGAQAAAAAVAGARPKTAMGLVLGAPARFLGERLSPDVYTNTQPLLDFKKTPPGRPPTGGVRVEF